MFCPACGSQSLESARFCVGCGAQLPSAHNAPVSAIAQAVTVAPDITSAVAIRQPTFSGFWRRMLAALIDIALYFLVGMVLVYLLLPQVVSEPHLEKFNSFEGRMVLLYFYQFYWLGMCLLIATIFECSPLQATPGKRLLGIKVVNVRGERTGIFRALLRNIGKILVFFSLGIGLLMMAFTGRKQALHDKFSGCLLVQKMTPSETVAATTGNQGGTTIVAAVVLTLLMLLPLLTIFYGGRDIGIIASQDNPLAPDDPKVYGLSGVPPK